MSKKEKYCGIGTVPKNKTRGSMLECVEKGEVRYWGLRAADKKTLQKAHLNRMKTSALNLKNDILDMKDKYKKMTNKTKKAELMKQMSAKNELFEKKQKEIIEFKKKEPEPEPEPEPKTKPKKNKESGPVGKTKKDEEDDEIEDMHYHLDKLITSLKKIKKDYPHPKKHDDSTGNNNIYLNINTYDTKQPGQYPMQPQPIQPIQTMQQPIQPIQPIQTVEPEQSVQTPEKKPAAKKKWPKVETVDPLKKIGSQKIDAKTQSLKDKMTEELKKIKPAKIDESFKSNLAALLRAR
jgi:hypothetical protein